MKTIEVSTQKYGIKQVLVDDEDYEFLMQKNWYIAKNGNTFYAQAYVGVENGKQKNILMHRLILGLTDSKILVDHADHNGLNNQRDNLRIATHRQNMVNKIPHGRSIYLGVFRNKSKYKGNTYIYWQAAISDNGEKLHLGCFKTEEEAAIAYNKAAEKIHGEFANLNKL